MSRTFRDRPHWYQNIFPRENKPLERDKFYNGYDGRYGFTNEASEHPSGDDFIVFVPGGHRKFSKKQHVKKQRRIGRQTIAMLLQEEHEGVLIDLEIMGRELEELYGDMSVEWEDYQDELENDPLYNEDVFMEDPPFDPMDELDYYLDEPEPERCRHCGQPI